MLFIFHQPLGCSDTIRDIRVNQSQDPKQTETRVVMRKAENASNVTELLCTFRLYISKRKKGEEEFDV